MDLINKPASDRDSEESATLRRLLPILARLRQDPEAAALTPPLERALDAHLAVRGIIDRALLGFLDTLLNKHARTNDAPATVRLAARLASRNRQAGAWTGKPGDLHLSDGETPSADMLEQHLVSLLWATSRAPARTDRVAAPESPEQARQNRSRRDGLETSMNTLAAALAHAESESSDLVAHIHQVRLAISPTETTTPESYGLLVGAAEELIRGQEEIAARLNAAHELLAQVRASQRELGPEASASAPPLLQHTASATPDGPFVERLQSEMRRAERFHSPLSLAVIIPERAETLGKIVNPTVRDEITRCYLQQVLGTHRAYDMVVRRGAQDFAWLLPNTGQYEALSALRNAQQRVGKTRYQWDGRDWPVPDFFTGLTRYRPGDTTETLIERADRAAHRAREGGKQRVAVE